jgi:gas vesicle protein
MGQSTEELNTQIAGTRDHLAADLDALQDKISPAAIVERRKAAARGRMGDLRNKVMGTAQDARDSAASTASGAGGSVRSTASDAKGMAQDVASRTGDTIEGSPIAAGLVAFGAGVVLAGLVPASAKETRAASQLVDAAKEQAQPMIEDAKAAGQDIAESLKETAGQAVDDVRSSAQDSAERVKEEGASSADSVREEVQG